MTELTIYSSLFFAAFVASTLLPAQSELILGGLIVTGEQPLSALLTVATLGNVLGSTVNWALGRYFYHLKDKKWFPIKQPALVKAERLYAKYGRWTLLLSWMPIVGDPLTLIAGLLREPLWSFVVIVTIAKLGRYLAVAAVSLGWFAA